MLRLLHNAGRLCHRHGLQHRRALLSSQAVPKYGQYLVPPVEESMNFQVGQPAPSMLPLDMIRECAAHKLAETDPLLLQYGYISGYPAFRKALAGFLTEGYGHDVDPERVFATNGVSGGLALICSIFLRSGDLIFAEEPSYFLALSIFNDYDLKVEQIPMEEDGLDMVALEARLKAGVVPKYVYTIPTAHNPTGRTMSVAKRKRLVELSEEYGFGVLADEVYQLLTFPHVTPPPPMWTFDRQGTVLSLGSFSKILAPAMRLGWIQAAPEVLGEIFACGQLDSSGGMNPVISSFVHSAIDLGHQSRHLQEVRQTLWDRASALMEALDEHLPEDCSYEVPDGGYFVLVKLPEDVSAADVLEEGAARHKVQFLPGNRFADSMANYLRLSFSYYDPADQVIGAQRLAAAIRVVQGK